MNTKIKITFIFIIIAIILLIVGLILLAVDSPEVNSPINGFNYLQFFGLSWVLNSSQDGLLISGTVLSIIIAPILLIGSLIALTIFYMNKNKK